MPAQAAQDGSVDGPLPRGRARASQGHAPRGGCAQTAAPGVGPPVGVGRGAVAPGPVAAADMRAPRHGASGRPRDALPRGRRRRRKAGGGRAGRGRVPLRTSICERPYGQDDGSRFGEREADGVIGAGCSLRTEVGRRARFPMAAIVPDETAAASVAAQEAMFSRLPAAARTGATHDDGTEFARHAELRDEPGMATYFADELLESAANKDAALTNR